VAYAIAREIESLRKKPAQKSSRLSVVPELPLIPKTLTPTEAKKIPDDSDLQAPSA
jgi:hypothetical protein